MPQTLSCYYRACLYKQKPRTRASEHTLICSPGPRHAHCSHHTGYDTPRQTTGTESRVRLFSSTLQAGPPTLRLTSAPASAIPIWPTKGLGEGCAQGQQCFHALPSHARSMALIRSNSRGHGAGGAAASAGAAGSSGGELELDGPCCGGGGNATARSRTKIGGCILRGRAHPSHAILGNLSLAGYIQRGVPVSSPSEAQEPWSDSLQHMKHSRSGGKVQACARLQVFVVCAHHGQKLGVVDLAVLVCVERLYHLLANPCIQALAAMSAKRNP